MQRTICLTMLPACGLALTTKPLARFMALAQAKDECSPHLYTGPSGAEYEKLLADIDADCKRRADDLMRAHDENLKDLEDECERQKRILAGKEADHAEEKADVKAQEKIVAKEKMDVKEARIKVRELAHCPPELVQAKEELAEQEAIPNDLPADIDAECEAQKLVMEKQACVDELRAAEGVLSRQKGQHVDEKSDLGAEESEEDHAAGKIPPQEKRVQDACRAFEDAKNAGPSSKSLDEIKRRCQAKKDALSKEADASIESLLNDYLRQKKILEGKEADHADEKADVDKQEDVVAQERLEVKEAKVVVRRKAHCPPELVKAKEELAEQEAIPNDTHEDIDAECVAKKAVMEAEQCVEKLRKAEAVLSAERGEHKLEYDDLTGEEKEEDKAAVAVPPQQKIVCELKAALDAARDAKNALLAAQGKKEDAPKQAEEASAEKETKTETKQKESEDQKDSEEQKKSGATRFSVGFTVMATLLATLVRA